MAPWPFWAIMNQGKIRKNLKVLIGPGSDPKSRMGDSGHRRTKLQQVLLRKKNLQPRPKQLAARIQVFETVRRTAAPDRPGKCSEQNPTKTLTRCTCWPLHNVLKEKQPAEAMELLIRLIQVGTASIKKLKVAKTNVVSCLKSWATTMRRAHLPAQVVYLDALSAN